MMSGAARVIAMNILAMHFDQAHSTLGDRSWIRGTHLKSADPEDADQLTVDVISRQASFLLANSRDRNWFFAAKARFNRKEDRPSAPVPDAGAPSTRRAWWPPFPAPCAKPVLWADRSIWGSSICVASVYGRWPRASSAPGRIR